MSFSGRKHSVKPARLRSNRRAHLVHARLPLKMCEETKQLFIEKEFHIQTSTVQKHGLRVVEKQLMEYSGERVESSSFTRSVYLQKNNKVSPSKHLCTVFSWTQHANWSRAEAHIYLKEFCWLTVCVCVTVGKSLVGTCKWRPTRFSRTLCYKGHI